MFVPLLIFVTSLVILVKASELTIKGCIKFSKLIGISQFAAGFIFVAVATSLPEFSVAIISSLAGQGIISVGNVTGANVTDITLIFGLGAVLVGFALTRYEKKKILHALAITSIVAATLLFLGRANFMFGLGCIGTFILFSYAIVKEGYAIEPFKYRFGWSTTLEILKTLFSIIICVSVVIVAAKFIVSSLISLAGILGIAGSLIAAVVLAFGTSLPELSVSLLAFKKGNISLAIGNCFGTIVTNLTLILGTAAMFGPIALDEVTKNCLIVLLFVNIITLFLVIRGKFKWPAGLLLFALYGIFVAVALITGFITT